MFPDGKYQIFVQILCSDSNRMAVFYGSASDVLVRCHQISYWESNHSMVQYITNFSTVLQYFSIQIIRTILRPAALSGFVFVLDMNCI